MFMIVCSEERVRKGAEKLSRHLNAKQQGRLDGFFTVQPKKATPKAEDKPKGKDKGKGKADTRGKKRKVGKFYMSLTIATLITGYHSG